MWLVQSVLTWEAPEGEAPLRDCRGLELPLLPAEELSSVIIFSALSRIDTWLLLFFD